MAGLLSIAHWQPVDPPSMAALLQEQGPGLVRSIWLSDSRTSPRDLYCYLKTRFGPPNGLAMLYRKPSTDNIIQWQYAVRAGDHYLIISGTNRATEFIVLDREPFPDCDKDALMTLLKADYANRGQEISAVRRSLEQWDLFTNPYSRLDKTVNTLLARLRKLDLTEPIFNKPAGTHEELDTFNAARRKWVESIQEARLLGASLRMIVPVLGESFVNLLIFLLAKPEVAQDERLMQEHLRQPIDVRIKGLHLYGRGYARPVDTAHPKFKTFHSVMNNRNDLLHANVNPLALRFDRVWFDGTIPLFDEESSFLHRVVRNSLAGLAPEQAISDADAVRGFTEFVLEHLEPQVACDIRMAMKHEQLGWRAEVGRVGILFSNTPVEFIPGEGPS